MLKLITKFLDFIYGPVLVKSVLSVFMFTGILSALTGGLDWFRLIFDQEASDYHIIIVLASIAGIVNIYLAWSTLFDRENWK